MAYKLACIATDGDFVTEYQEFDTVEEVWDFCNNMGSRWFFYPYPVVFDSKTKIVVSTTEEFSKDWNNLDLHTFAKLVQTLWRTKELIESEQNNL